MFDLTDMQKFIGVLLLTVLCYGGFLFWWVHRAHFHPDPATRRAARAGFAHLAGIRHECSACTAEVVEGDKTCWHCGTTFHARPNPLGLDGPRIRRHS